MQFLKSKEKETHKLNNYVGTHKTVSEQSRAKLIDWLSELHYKYKMFPETIFTVVSLVDQYLSAKEIPLSELQLVGVAALYIAAKFEETYQVPQAKQLVSCCAGQYTTAQILDKEADIIKELNFELIVNSAYKFFEPLARIIGL
jgi:cyclin B